MLIMHIIHKYPNGIKSKMKINLEVSTFSSDNLDVTRVFKQFFRYEIIKCERAILYTSNAQQNCSMRRPKLQEMKLITRQLDMFREL